MMFLGTPPKINVKQKDLKLRYALKNKKQYDININIKN